MLTKAALPAWHPGMLALLAPGGLTCKTQAPHVLEWCFAVRAFNLQAPLLSGQSEVTVGVGPLALVGIWLASPVELA